MADNTDTLPGEIWKPVAGFEASHLVSNFGRVRTVAHWVNSKNGSTALRQGRMLGLYVSRKTGYPQINMKRKTINVHRLVCAAFHGPAPFPNAQVAHNDGSRSNNRADNLRWTTAKGNAEDRNRHGTDPRGERGPSRKLTENKVLAIRAEYKGQIGDLTRLGRKYGVSKHQISHIVHRKQWTHI